MFTHETFGVGIKGLVYWNLTYAPFVCRCRDGQVKFWRVPQLVPSLKHLCRVALRFSVSTYQVEALPLPKKILEYLTYRDIPKQKIIYCKEHCS